MSVTYRPALFTKRGERRALADTPGSVKAQLNPVFIVEPIAWDYDNDAPAKSIDQHMATKADDLVQSWGKLPAAIDLELHDDEPMSNGEHPLVWLSRKARDLGLPLLPSIGIDRSAAQRAAAANVVARDGEGATVRLPLTEWPINTGGAAQLDALLLQLGIAADEVDLVLDLGAEVVEAPGIALTAVQGQLRSLPHLSDWRSVTIAGAGFPKALGGYSKQVNVTDRVEWDLYTTVIGSAPARPLLFGDYAIAHPDPLVDVNPAWMSISAALRYTIDRQWLVPKGELFKGPGGSGLGGAAVAPLASALVARPEWMGPGHCSMEDWVINVVGGASGGGPEQWRQQGTRHHLQVATDQLAILGVP